MRAEYLMTQDAKVLYFRIESSCIPIEIVGLNLYDVSRMVMIFNLCNLWLFRNV